MFILTKISDLVEIAPWELYKPSAIAIEDHINHKYANRVIQKIGLCICLYDLLWVSEGVVGTGTGIVNVNVEFRLVVFRPFKHEVLVGRISSSDPGGINLRTEFFDEIRIQHNMLPAEAYFDHSEQIWIWDCEGTRLYYDHQEVVRFRVETEQWFDQSPMEPEKQDEELSESRSPYILEGSMGEPGLGPVLWWD